ncbi:MAG: PAS domain S-box protein [Thiohalomonadaceae bacterium]
MSAGNWASVAWLWRGTARRERLRAGEAAEGSVPERETSVQCAVPEDALGEALFEHAPVLVVVLDAQGRILRFNRACQTLSGLAPEAVRGRFLWEVLVDDGDAAALREAFQGASLTTYPRQYLNRWHTSGGDVRQIAWTETALPDGEGGVAQVLAMGNDLTAQKRAERALRNARDDMERRIVLRTAALRTTNEALARSEARLAEAQRIAHIGSWDWDVVHDQLYWSDEVFRILGLAPHQLGPSVEQFLLRVCEEDRPQVQGALDMALKQRAPYSVDFHVRHPDGRIRVVHAEGVVTYDAAGVPVRMAGTLQDITERKTAEEALRRATNELEARVAERTAELARANQALRFTQFAVDHAADAVIWTDAARRLVYVNEAACGLLGCSRDQIVGADFAAIMQDAKAAGMLSAARGSGSITFESQLRRRDRSTLPVEITANALVYEGTEYFCLFARDITERRRDEEIRRSQLMAARALSSISSRFVARDDIEHAIREGLAELAALMQADCAYLLRLSKSTGLAAEWYAGCCEQGAHPDLGEALAALPALHKGEVVLGQAGAGDGISVFVPLFAEQVLVGVIAFSNAHAVERWREGDFPLLRVAARVITAAIQRNRAELQTMTLLEENRRLARESLEIQERERAHLARELHDELGQCLTAIRADAQSICRLSRDREPRIYASGQAIGEVASRVYEVVRNMMRRLRPEMLDELGLGEALREIVGQWRTRHPDIVWSLTMPDSLGPFPEAVQITAYRLVQEAITNVIKHAQASRVEVCVKQGDGSLTVSVADDGRGLEGAPHGGLGLLGMRERVLAAGGRFDIQSHPGRGFRISAVFPIESERGECEPCRQVKR